MDQGGIRHGLRRAPLKIAVSFLLLLATSVLPVESGSAQTKPLVTARARLTASDWKGAIAALRGLEGSDDAAVHLVLARAYSELADDVPGKSDVREAHLERALTHARRAVELTPRSGDAHLSLAVVNGKLAQLAGPRGRLKRADVVKAEAEEALRLDPSLWEAHHVLGIWHREIATLDTFKKLGASLLGGVPDASLEEAITHLETARRLAPNSIRNHLELGRTYLEADRDQDARKEFERAIALRPSEPRDPVLQREARRELADLGS